MDETGRQTKGRIYDHRIIKRKDSTRSDSFRAEKVELPTCQATRKSQRNPPRIGYKTMDSWKKQLLLVVGTVVSELMEGPWNYITTKRKMSPSISLLLSQSGLEEISSRQLLQIDKGRLQKEMMEVGIYQRLTNPSFRSFTWQMIR